VRPSARLPVPRRLRAISLRAPKLSSRCVHQKALRSRFPTSFWPRGWATFHNLTMVVRVDHGSEDEEYEEVIELGWGTRSRAHFILWTNSEAVFVQPMPGKMHRHASLAEALESLPVQHAMVLTDIAATVWPAD
jgi:hypothetical protein